MKSFKSLAIAALLSLNTVQGATDAVQWDYLSNGADWPYIKADGFQCHEQCQSPIDLRTDDHTEPFQKGNGKEFTKNYNDFTGATVKNLGKTIQVNFPDDDSIKNNYFTSGYAKDVLKGDEKFNSLQFHFHAKSEHTIMGKRYDFEMHTVHAPLDDGLKHSPADTDSDVPILYSAFGLMFDVDDYDPTITAAERATIDEFFDSLGFGNLPTGDAKGHVMATDAKIPFGALMKIVDASSRWVYTGSLTTPPCTVGVYFQVVERVLPISKKHYDQYIMQQMYTNQTSYILKNGASHEVKTDAPITKLSATGNWRITNAIDRHNVTYMRSTWNADDEARHKRATVVVAIFFALFFLSCIVVLIFIRNYKKQIAAKEPNMNEGGGFHTVKMVSDRKENQSVDILAVNNP